LKVAVHGRKGLNKFKIAGKDRQAQQTITALFVKNIDFIIRSFVISLERLILKNPSLFLAGSRAFTSQELGSIPAGYCELEVSGLIAALCTIQTCLKP
jgi:hypothetical protein